MIFKVQLSISPDDSTRSVLIYNKKRDILWQGEASEELIKALRKQQKSFWHGKYTKEKQIELTSQAEWQDW